MNVLFRRQIPLILGRGFSSKNKVRCGYSNTNMEPKTMKLESEEFRALFTPELVKLSDLFKKDSYQLRIAGGAVRDLLMGIPPADVDFASTATPTEMKLLFERENIRMLHKRGEEHGTITCRIDDKENFEITTLRVDILCDGRRAQVEYTTDWQLDANRRDLTINSLFLDLDGNVIDYFGGIEDVKNCKVKFVGDAGQRIQEDYLRILRYFRFFGRISSSNEHDEQTIEAINKYKDGMKGISAERIWTELKKIVVGRMAPEVVRSMIETCGLNEYLGLPAVCNLDRFEKVYTNFPKEVEPMTMVACLCQEPGEVDEFHKRTKLSNAERDIGKFVVSLRESAEKHMDDMEWWKEKVVDLEVKPGPKIAKPTGRECVLQLARSVILDADKIEELEAFELPVFPVKGTDLKDAGIPAGPNMRIILEKLYDCWKESEFAMTKEDLTEKAKELKDSVQPPAKKRKS